MVASMTDAQNTSCLPPVTLDSSQSPQDITSARLPTPSQQTFCEPCKAFLRGDSTECFGSDRWRSNSKHEYIHHVDAESFQRALELPCVICIRLYKGFQDNRTTYNGGPTHYYFDKDNGHLYFWSHGHLVVPNLLPYESRPDLHYQHITQNTGDTKALSFLKSQYYKCRGQHSKCQRLAPYNDFTPTRTIYVGSAGEEAVRLCDRAEMIAGAAYAVLSHCWGKKPQQILLTKSTVTMLQEGIALSSLPRTFQDAIAVTRDFKIQYIWIDSLCIFQDDLRDWAAEASRIRDVYSKAEFCIAATDAESGNVGLFFDRDVEQLTPVIVEATWSNKDDTSDSSKWPRPGSYLFGFYEIHPRKAIDLAPLNGRAWVTQERFLSPRILHFTKDLLFWECHTCLANENDPLASLTRFVGELNILKKILNNSKTPESSVRPLQDIIVHNTSNDTKHTNPRQIYGAWNQFLHLYTACGITKESDILVALAGVADEVGHATNDCLVAGLWKKRFIEQLCWRVYGKTSRPSIWRAPSWSWASFSGAVRDVPRYKRPHGMAAIIASHISTKPSGEVEQGSILLQCRLIPATVNKWVEYKTSHVCGTLDRRILTSFTEALNFCDNELITIQFDVKDDPCHNADQTVDIQLLALMKEDKKEGDDISLAVMGICVVNSKNQDSAFERVGHFEAWYETAKPVLAAYNQAPVQSILLV